MSRIRLVRKAIHIMHISYPFCIEHIDCMLLMDFSLTAKAATLILISRLGSAISSAKEGKSVVIY